jgi:hypothetical protein
LQHTLLKGGNMKRNNWLKAVGAGVVIACLAIPLTAQATTSAGPKQNQSLTAADQSAAYKQKNALHAQKLALLKERRQLAKQGNKEALDANSAKISAVNAKLKAGRKGGAK